MARLLLIFTLTILVQTLHAQRIMNYSFAPAGTTFNTSDIRGVWNIGELTKSTTGTDNLIIAQGYVRNDIVMQITGNDEALSDKDFMVYPNPVRDIVNIEWKSRLGDNRPITFKLYDLSGHLMSINPILAGDFTHQINMTELNNGIYLMVIEKPGMSRSVKLKIIKGISYE